MKNISWNYQGFRNPPTICELNRLIREKKPSISFFLIETKILTAQVEKIHCRNCLTHYFSVNPIGRGGSLALFWNDDITLEVINFSNFHSHTKIREKVFDVGWFLTGFIEIPKQVKRQIMVHFV